MEDYRKLDNFLLLLNTFRLQIQDLTASHIDIMSPFYVSYSSIVKYQLLAYPESLPS